MDQTYITLNNGAKIPQFGMGVFMVPAGDATKNACLDALKMPYQGTAVVILVVQAVVSKSFFHLSYFAGYKVKFMP